MIDVNQAGEIFQIKMSAEMGGKPLYWVAAYLVDGLLIDTGCMRTSEEFIEYLAGKNIDLIVNTHHHEDHVGANNILAQKFGVAIMAHPEEIPLMSRVPELNPYQELVWGYPEPSVACPITKSIEIGSLNFEVVHTPGHCAGHIALVEPNRGWCFSGDLFVSENQKVFRADEDINTIIDSVKKLLKLDVPGMKIFTSIGRICTGGHKALESFVEYMEEIREKSLNLYGKGYSPAEIRDAVFGRESSLRDLTGGHYSIENLVRSLIRI
ncbi:MAG: MBL fold metallo-hydrolase [Bacillota bacterium]